MSNNQSNIDESLIVAFVQGAQWWEHKQIGATMWPSDRELAEREAKKALDSGTLGVKNKWLFSGNAKQM